MTFEIRNSQKNREKKKEMEREERDRGKDKRRKIEKEKRKNKDIQRMTFTKKHTRRDTMGVINSER